MSRSLQDTVNKIILALNLVTYRIDAMLANIIDGVLILGYKVIMSLMLGHEINWSSSLPSMISLSVLLHILYTITYIINDSIDYASPHSFKVHLDDSFYKLRPIYYFRKSKFIIIYTILLYATYIAVILMLMPSLFYPLIFFVALVTVVSILHSICSASMRVVTFCLLRAIKYTYLLILFDLIIFNQPYDDITILVMLTLVFPYVTYSTMNYGKLMALKNKMIRSIVAPLTPAIMLLIMFLRETLKHQLIDIIIASVFCYFSIILPILGIRYMLRRLFGATNPTYYHHVLRLILGAVLTLSIVVLLFYTLALILL